MNPTPTLSLPLKGREIVMYLPLQGGGQEGDRELSKQEICLFNYGLISNLLVIGSLIKFGVRHR